MTPLETKEGSNTTIDAKKWGYRNVYALSISLGIVYTGYYGLVSVQSSINPTIGLVSLTLMSASAFVGAFVTPTMLRLVGTKYAIFCGYSSMLLYTLANFYPTSYTLIPTSVIAGFTSRPMWAALMNNSMEVAVSIAPVLKKSKDYLISKFSGILVGFYVSSYVSGNLASSLILYPYTQVHDDNVGSANHTSFKNYSSGNSTGINLLECDIDGSDIEKLYIYILTSVYVVIQAIGTLVLLVFVDKLPNGTNFISTKKKLDVYFKQPLKNIFSVLKSVRMLLVAPIITLWGLEISFALGTFTQVYISDCFGTYQVGFTLMVLGATSAIVCVACGRLSKYIPQFIIVIFGATLMFILLSFLLIWDRVPSYPVIFTFAVGWGCADAVWSTQSTGLTGILFPNKSQTAYSAVQVWLGVGYTLGYAMAEFLPLKEQIYVFLVLVTITSICSFILEVTYLKNSSHLWSKCQCSSSSSEASKLSEVVTTIQVSAINPIAFGEINRKSRLSTPTGNAIVQPSHKTIEELHGLALDDREGTKPSPPVIVSAENPLFEVYKLGLETPNTSHDIVLNQIVLPTELPKLDALNAVPYHSDSNLLQQSIRFSQSYMDALDNVVEMQP